MCTQPHLQPPAHLMTERGLGDGELLIPIFAKSFSNTKIQTEKYSKKHRKYGTRSNTQGTTQQRKAAA
jgi:hypothetical protein